MQSWFVLKSGLVSGPFTSENVLSNFTDQNVMIWGLNCNEWLNFSDWQVQLQSGTFKNEEVAPKIFINPNTNSKSNPEGDSVAKIFKINPKVVQETDKLTNIDSELNLKDNVVEFKAPNSKQQNLSDFEKTAIAPLPDLPLVEDIDESDEKLNLNQEGLQNSEDPITQLEGQLKDLLTDEDFGSDGKTLVQATIDGMNDEILLPDETNQVQSFDMSSIEDSLSEEPSDGATRVQAFDLSSIEEIIPALENNESNNVQSFDMSSIEDNLSEEPSDGATRVQGFDLSSIEESIPEVENDGATKVQSFDMSSLEDNLSEDPSDGATRVQGFDLSSIEEISQPNEVLSAESTLKENKLDIANAILPDINEIIKAEILGEIQMANDNDSNEGSGPNEKTNIAELKDISQSLEQKKILEKPVWYVAYNGVSEGPMNVETLLKKLDAFEHKDFIYLWKKGFPDWMNLFSTPQISSQLGIGFRRHDRFPFSGTVKIEFNGNIQIGQLENLSLSGLGATGFGPLVLGEKVKVTLDCPDLDQEVEFTAMIRFSSDLGVLGLSYVNTEYAENVNKVIDLVKNAASKLEAA